MFKLNTPYRTNDNTSIEIGIIVAEISGEVDNVVYIGFTISADYDSSISWGFSVISQQWLVSGSCLESDFSNLTNDHIENEVIFSEHELYKKFCKDYLVQKYIDVEAKIPLVHNANRENIWDDCCNREKRGMDGSCMSCGDPCL